MLKDRKPVKTKHFFVSISSSKLNMLCIKGYYGQTEKATHKMEENIWNHQIFQKISEIYNAKSTTKNFIFKNWQ